MNAQANVLAELLNAGYLSIYDGNQPASADEAVTNQKLLARLKFGDPAFKNAVDGTIRATEIKKEPNAKATGKATWSRCYMLDNKTSLLDGSVGTKNSNLVLKSVEVQKGSEVSVLSFQHTVPKQ